MKLSPPEESIEIYSDGFGNIDPFSRIPVGKNLSALIENVDEPLVIAIDGAWGTGKTHFLKRWVGAHKNENDGAARTVYFDAFAHDFLEDPLVAITSAIDEKILDGEKKDSWKKVRRSAAKLAQPVMRVGLAVVSSGLSEPVGAVTNALFEGTREEVEKAAEKFWKKEDGRRAAMKQFADSLEEFTNEIGAPRKLVIVIDELDRCRPDYALTVLEVIKHFFAVPNVHFVLGVNRQALESSVRARYGADFDAGHYLHRFISLTMRLPQTLNEGRTDIVAGYLENAGAAMNIETNFIEVIQACVSEVANADLRSMRSARRILTFAALASINKNFRNPPWGRLYAVAIVLTIRAMNANLYTRVLDQTATFSEMKAFFGIEEDVVDLDHLGLSDQQRQRIHGVIAILTGSDDAFTGDDRRTFSDSLGYDRGMNGRRALSRIINSYVEVYSFPDSDPVE